MAFASTACLRGILRPTWLSRSGCRNSLPYVRCAKLPVAAAEPPSLRFPCLFKSSVPKRSTKGLTHPIASLPPYLHSFPLFFFGQVLKNEEFKAEVLGRTPMRRVASPLFTCPPHPALCLTKRVPSGWGGGGGGCDGCFPRYACLELHHRPDRVGGWRLHYQRIALNARAFACSFTRQRVAASVSSSAWHVLPTGSGRQVHR
eukprot:3610879-Rhodomonas_salina.1